MGEATKGGGNFLVIIRKSGYTTNCVGGAERRLPEEAEAPAPWERRSDRFGLEILDLSY